MPTSAHEQFLASVETAIDRQLQLIRDGSDTAALFAQKVFPARSSEIFFPVDDAPPNVMSKHDPDASFWHETAFYPGVIVEVLYSHEAKIDRLVESYLLDSDASVQVVVGFDIHYGQHGSRKATFSVWRTRIYNTTNGDELTVFQEIANEVRCLLNQRLLITDWCLSFSSFNRHSVTIKAILQTIQAYAFTWEILPARNLSKIFRSKINIANSQSPLNNYANISMRRKSGSKNHQRHLACVVSLLE